MSNLFGELKRRNVFRVGAAYAVVGWLIIQLIDTLVPMLGVPEWVGKAILLVVLAGFPIALLFSWAFEMTPQGVKSTTEVDADKSITPSTGRKLNYVIGVALIAALGFIAWDKLGTGPAPTSVAETDAVKTIAVLAFVNMSNDPDQEFFSDGISEELLNVLAKVKGLRVTSRTSAFAFKGTNTPIPEVAAQLGVQYVLEGSVRRGGGQVRITTQLIDVATDSHLWSETYDRDITDVFAVQDEIAAEVSSALQVALLGADATPVETSHVTDIAVYSDYLLARQKLADRSTINLIEAERLLKTVVERDPDYAEAYAALASTYIELGGWGTIDNATALARTRPMVEIALGLNDRLAEAWVGKAFVATLEGNPAEALAARERALALDPANPMALRDAVWQGLETRRPEAAGSLLERLLQVDPISPASLRLEADYNHRIGRMDAAKAALNRIRAIDPENLDYHWGWIVGVEDRSEIAFVMALVPDSIEIDPTDPEAPAYQSYVSLALGDAEGAGDSIDRAFAMDANHAYVLLRAMLWRIWRGDDAAALETAAELARPERSGRNGSAEFALHVLTAADIAAGRHGQAADRYLTLFPALSQSRVPLAGSLRSFDVVLSVRLMAALDLARIYQDMGELAKADALLTAVEEEIPYWPRLGHYGSRVADVQLWALRGETDKALAALREAVDAGWWWDWRWHLEYNLNLESIRAAPEFRAIVAEMEADMAEQLTLVRAAATSDE